jgi:hypothetical protein
MLLGSFGSPKFGRGDAFLGSFGSGETDARGSLSGSFGSPTRLDGGRQGVV